MSWNENKGVRKMGTCFSHVYDPLMSPLEKKYIGGLRRKLISGQTGNILEVGAGTGLNFPYYDQAEKVVAVEPDSSMREKSLARAQEARVLIELVEASGESLPFADDTFDAAVAALVFCTIPEPEQALRELSRVCKPGAPILFLEHVRLEGPLGKLQDGLTPVWKKMCDGCHLNRDTISLVENNFQMIRVERHLKNIFVLMEAMNEKMSKLHTR
ncbi:class I SAM-dependent methyltransferase [Virgibacillus sediminis]|uniref:Class I SAM-dependent methyltransferase n=1 Tax=Virgibacillus sediminis TaxID=202260 RepID=A0ABV7A1W2_9BACI